MPAVAGGTCQPISDYKGRQHFLDATLAKAAIRLLPELEANERLEVNKIYSARGELQANELVLSRPFQEASNSITDAALFGGGKELRPGLISAAHRGVLFFDEVNLTQPSTFERLRSPWENGEIEIQRAHANCRFPAQFQFIGAMNPCKCSWLFHYECSVCNRILVQGQSCPDHPKATTKSRCTCSRSDVERYLGRLSNPIKDRIAIVCLVSKYDQEYRWNDQSASRTVRTRIKVAWDRQKKRYEKIPRISCNGDVEHVGQLKEFGGITNETVAHLDELLDERGVEINSLRKKHQLLTLSRTVADLAGSNAVAKKHLASALSISGLDHGVLG